MTFKNCIQAYLFSFGILFPMVFGGLTWWYQKPTWESAGAAMFIASLGSSGAVKYAVSENKKKSEKEGDRP